MAGHVSPDAVTWACGFGGAPADDCGIEAVHEPSFTTRPWVEGDDRVIGLRIGDDARAYPVRMLDNHEIVTDTVGGLKVSVTWCPLCGSAVVYERIVAIDGRPTEVRFDVSGYLYKHDLVMYDRATKTLWTQIDGTPIGSWDGRRVVADHPEARLEQVPSELTSWTDWSERHPGTRLLSNEGRGYGGAYQGYGSSCRFGVSGTSQCNVTGLHPKEQVIGVSVGGAARAWPVFGVRADGGIVLDRVGDHDVVVATNRAGAAWVYDAADHGFSVRDGVLVDARGRSWDVERGRDRGGLEDLQRIDHLVLFWFAWKVHHPDTTLWVPSDASGAMGLDGGQKGLPAVGPALVVAFVLLVLGRTRRGGRRPRDVVAAGRVDAGGSCRPFGPLQTTLYRTTGHEDAREDAPAPHGPRL